MKTSRRLRAWLTARTWLSLTVLLLLGLGEAWMTVRFLEDFERQSSGLLVRSRPVPPHSPHLPLP